MKISSNIFSDSNDENNCPHKLLLFNTHISKFHKASANRSSANKKLSKPLLHEIGQSRWFLVRLLVPLLKTALPLIGNVLEPLARSL